MPAGRVIEISMSCRNLKNADFLSLSDPFVVLFVRAPRHVRPVMQHFLEARTDDIHRPAVAARVSCTKDAGWQYAGETEVVWNELSPDFVVKFFLPVDAPGVAAMPVRFEVYDMDKFDAPLDAQDFLGACETTVRTLMDPEERVRVAPLEDKKKRVRRKLGELRTAVEVYEVPAVPHLVTLHTCFAINCGFPENEQVFFVLSRARAERLEERSELWTRVYRSGPVHNPRGKREWGFQDVTLPEDRLTAGMPGRRLRVELFFHRKNGSHVRVGATQEFAFEELDRGVASGTFRVIPDAQSGAGLESAVVGITPQFFGKPEADKETMSAPLLLASAESSVRSSLAGLDSSSIVFRFGNFVWHSKSRREALMKPLKSVRATTFPS